MSPSSSTVILQRFADQIEAEAIRGRLALEGIDAFIRGTDNAAAFGMGGAPFASGIRLEVFAEDFGRAEALLIHDREQLDLAGDWECPRCGEPNEPAFEVCWSCQKQRPDDLAGGLSKSNDSVSSQTPTGEFSLLVKLEAVPNQTANNVGPYRPVLVSQDSSAAIAAKPSRTSGQAEIDDEEKLEAEIRRLWLLCVIAIVGLPLLLSLYALYRVVKIEREVESTEGFQARLWILFGIHLVILAASMIYWVSIFSWPP